MNYSLDKVLKLESLSGGLNRQMNVFVNRWIGWMDGGMLVWMDALMNVGSDGLIWS